MSPDPADSGSRSSFQIAPPAVALPKGGGAIRGIGEKFSANPATGTGSLSVPLAISPGRGFEPQLRLAYDSGGANGPFGFGWSLNLPAITRKTEKGIPRYRDQGDSDVFLLSGVEDLVPVLVGGGTRWSRKPAGSGTLDGRSFQIYYYRPRIEGLFARIERWVAVDNSETLWRSISRENVTTWYGRSGDSRIADPAETSRTFSWLICESHDDKGNVIAYEYAPENSANVDRSRVNEVNRGEKSRTANRYIKRIKYGNKRSRAADPAGFGAAGWMFHVVFDYDDGHYADASAAGADPFYVTARGERLAAVAWPARQDPFSTYRAGFEIRTYRLCRRILMFHDFDELGGTPCLVRSTDLAYEEGPIASFVTAIGHSGYVRTRDAAGAFTDRYIKRLMPPLELSYSAVPRADELARLPVEILDAASIEHLPSGFSGAAHARVDLDGEGVSGVLAREQGAWYYKHNRGAGRLGPMAPVAALPSLAAGAGHQLLDLAGDGQLDVASFDSPTPGFYERTADRAWEPFRAFESVPHVAWNDPNLRAVDLTGDGHADLLISEDEAWVWYQSLGEAGFARAERVNKALDEERGPRVVFSDRTDTIFLSDMSGDGLPDLVRIRNGEVCYWPNLGYGRFGAKVTMHDSPWFDAPDQFDPNRIRLADTDGSGITDIVYLHRDGVKLYFNHAGNGWSAPVPVPQFPPAADPSQVDVADLFGSGTACLVRSSPLPGDAARPVQYVDLMAGRKPHLLVKAVNNLGASTEVEYAPSTRFYLADKIAGTAWRTRLPFPVHCVQKVIVTDKWRGSRFATTYSYHHGHYDGVEREFRGFGRVDQTDVESFGEFQNGNVASPYITADKKLYQPPIETVTWYHTGAVPEGAVLSQFAHEYFASAVEKPLPEPELSPEPLSAGEWREAIRACKGMILRQETYELDVDGLERGDHKRVRLFSVVARNCTIQRLQPREDNPHAVFLVTDSELLTYEYEQSLTAPVALDPRITHTLHLRLDEFGHVLQSVTAVYSRIGSYADPMLPASALALINTVQKERHLTYTEDVFTADFDAANDYRLRALCDARAYELTGVAPTSGFYFSLGELRDLRLSDRYQTSGLAVADIPYDQVASNASREKRIVSHTRTLFFAETLAGPLSFGAMGRLGLPYGSYRLALTQPLLQGVFGSKLTMDVQTRLADGAASGYLSGATLANRFPDLDTTGQYWTPSGVPGFAPDAADHFYLPERFTDPFGNVTAASYDGKYDLYIQSVVDAVNNRVGVEKFDFRALAPRVVKDANDNLAEACYDALGRLVASAAKGKGTEGDDVSAFDDDLLNPPLSALQTYFTGAFDETEARRLLDTATARHVYSFGETRDTAGNIMWAARPACACAVLREQHVASLPVASLSALQIGFEYSDGLGTVIVKKTQAEPASGAAGLRWIATGRTVLNNKGTPVQRYEPYFSGTEHRFEDPQQMGVTPLMYYDAAGRLIRTELPDGTISRVEFSAWHISSWDANDAVLESNWFVQRGSPDPDGPEPANPETRAAWLAAGHANTPAVAILDSVGRDAVTIAHNRDRYTAGGLDEKYLTHTKVDGAGRRLWTRDARGNLVNQCLIPPKPDDDPAHTVPAGSIPSYDVSGTLLFQRRTDAGERWVLADAMGQPMFEWDFNRRQDETSGQPIDEHRMFFTEYDAIRRPLKQWLSIGTTPPALIKRFTYGEGLSNDRARNLRGELAEQLDDSGRTEIDRLDFSGNLRKVRRTFTSRFRAPVVDWQTDISSQLENETFTQTTEYDALGRPTVMYHWHAGVGSRVAVSQRQYNERGLVMRETLDVGATKTATGHTASGRPVVNAIAEVKYNARGEREFLRLGNGTLTQYDYDPATFRLRQIRTTRPADEADFPSRRSGLTDPAIIQQLLYTYDAVGNVTAVRDDAYEPVFFANQQVDPAARYAYDSLYRLVRATGRESAQAIGAPGQFQPGAPLVQFPQTGRTLRNYAQRYAYDPVGNIERVTHSAQTAGQGNWVRQFEYESASNRLIRTSEGTGQTNAVIYRYDPHGNLLNLANVGPINYMGWSYRDTLRFIDLGGGGRVYYNHDPEKHLTRKVIEYPSGQKRAERMYLGGLEIFRRYTNGAVVEAVETLHVVAGGRRILVVDDVLQTNSADGPRTTFKYQYTNHLGSVCLELSGHAEIVSYEEYHPYGVTAYRATNSQIEAPAKRYGFMGMESDEDTGLHRHGVRYFAPWIARWVSCDPVEDPAVRSSYCAFRNNPIVYIDASGKQATGGPLYDASQLSGLFLNDEAEPARPPLYDVAHLNGALLVDEPAPPPAPAPKRIREFPESGWLADKIEMAWDGMVAFGNLMVSTWQEKNLDVGTMAMGTGMWARPSRGQTGRELTFIENHMLQRQTGTKFTALAVGFGPQTASWMADQPYSLRGIEDETSQNAFAFSGLLLGALGTAGAAASEFRTFATASMEFQSAMRSHEMALRTYAVVMAGRPQSEIAGLSLAIERMAWQNFKLTTWRFEYGAGRGIDVVGKGAGENFGLLATVEAKPAGATASALKKLKTSTIIGTFRQGGEAHVGMSLETYLAMGGPQAQEARFLLMQMRLGNVRNLASLRGGLFKLDYWGSVIGPY